MAYYADDIRRISKQIEDKQGLGDAEERSSVDGSTKLMSDLDYDPVPSSDSSIASPLTEQSRTTQTVLVYNPDDPTEWIEVEQAIQIIFEDANEAEVIMNLSP